MIRFALRTVCLTGLPVIALAHDGHSGTSTSHWHATDAWGFVAVAAIAVALWFIRKK